MNPDESEPWMQKMKRYFEQRGHGDDWMKAAKRMFTDGRVEASNDKAAAEIASYLEGGDERGERMTKALGVQSELDADNGDTEADSVDLTRAFDPSRGSESNALELEF
jgi:hypothetical protein